MKNMFEADREVLRARARILARPLTAPVDSRGTFDLLGFRLAQESYAVEQRFVQKVAPLKELTALPGTPAFMRGIVNVQGRILPVFDLKGFFELPEKGLADLHQIIVLEGHGLELGLLVDVITGEFSIPAHQLHS